MTIEQRLEQLELQNQRIERQNQQIERKNKRLTAVLAVLAVAICAVVTMAATGLKRGEFDIVKARHIWVTNDAGDVVVGLDATDFGNGLVWTQSGKGEELVRLSSTDNGYGAVVTYQPNGKELVGLRANEDGGLVYVYNKTGESIAQMFADEDGNGRQAEDTDPEIFRRAEGQGDAGQGRRQRHAGDSGAQAVGRIDQGVDGAFLGVDVRRDQHVLALYDAHHVAH